MRHFIDFIKSKKQMKPELFSILCEYDGYDLVFAEGTIDAKLYESFNEIIGPMSRFSTS